MSDVVFCQSAIHVDKKRENLRKDKFLPYFVMKLFIYIPPIYSAKIS